MLIKMMNRLKKEEKGFTLIELLAVIVILAVIAAIAVPYILGVINKSKDNADVATFHQVYEAARLYIAADQNGTAPGTIGVSTLISKDYLEDGIVYPSTKEKINGGTLTYTDGKLTGITITTTNGATSPTITTWTLSADSAISGSSSTAPTKS